MQTLTIAVYARRFLRADWRQDIDVMAIAALATELDRELAPFGWHVEFRSEPDVCVEVKGYGDLLNAVRLRVADAGNPCLGHVIGVSAARDPLADIRRGVNRLVFAPETIEPDAADKRVCHNCGCGC